CSRKCAPIIASLKLRRPRFSVYQLGRGSDPVMVVASANPLVAAYMVPTPDLSLIAASLLLRQSGGKRANLDQSVPKMGLERSSGYATISRETGRKPMADLKLTLACGPYDRMEALWTGKVKPEGIDLTYQTVAPPEVFDRMIDKQEFEIAEMG